MKRSQLKQLIKEELQNEITLKRPASRISSPEYKKFYQFAELCEYWDVNLNEDENLYFDPLNDFQFFYMLWNISPEMTWTPEYCIITDDEFEFLVKDVYELSDSQIQQVKAKIKEHSK